MAKEFRIKIPDFHDIFSVCSGCFRRLKTFFGFIWEKIKRISVRVFVRVHDDIRSKKIRGILLLVAFGLIFWRFGINAAWLWLLFLAFLFYGWENRIIAALALLCLLTCPFLLAAKKDDWAEAMAVYAYFFLVMTVVLQLVEYKREERAEKKAGQPAREG